MGQGCFLSRDRFTSRNRLEGVSQGEQVLGDEAEVEVSR